MVLWYKNLALTYDDSETISNDLYIYNYCIFNNKMMLSMKIL